MDNDERALGGTWDDLQKEIFTPEEIEASRLRVSFEEIPREESLDE